MRSSIIRGPLAVAFMSIEDYHQVHWPQVQSAVIKLLDMESGVAVSYEEISRLAFTICWNQHQHHLLEDLLQLAKVHLSHVATMLDSTVVDDGLLQALGAAAVKYELGCQSVVNAMSHLNRSIAPVQQNASLLRLLLPLFGKTVLQHASLRERLLRTLHSVPASALTPPQTDAKTVAQVSRAVLELWKFNPAFTSVNLAVFHVVIPESVNGSEEGSWHFHNPSGAGTSSKETSIDNDDLDIDIGEEASPANWMRPETSDMYPVDPGPQVLGKRRNMEEDNDPDAGAPFPQKRLNMFS